LNPGPRFDISIRNTKVLSMWAAATPSLCCGGNAKLRYGDMETIKGVHTRVSWLPWANVETLNLRNAAKLKLKLQEGSSAFNIHSFIYLFIVNHFFVNRIVALEFQVFQSSRLSLEHYP
jgi:hypothetical protein